MEKPKSKILKFFLLKERFRDGLRLLVEAKQQKKKKKGAQGEYSKDRLSWTSLQVSSLGIVLSKLSYQGSHLQSSASWLGSIRDLQHTVVTQMELVLRALGGDSRTNATPMTVPPAI